MYRQLPHSQRRRIKRQLGVPNHERIFGCCPICLNDRPLDIDHIPGTNEVRGFICRRCNHFVGHLDEAMNHPGYITRLKNYMKQEGG